LSRITTLRGRSIGDQAAEPLLQTQRRLRQRELANRREPAPRERVDRLRGHWKRKATMITQLSLSPGTSIPSQKLACRARASLASSKAFRAGGADRRCPPEDQHLVQIDAVFQAEWTSRSCRCEVNKTSVRPPTRRATDATTSVTCSSNAPSSGPTRSVAGKPGPGGESRTERKGSFPRLGPSPTRERK